VPGSVDYAQLSQLRRLSLTALAFHMRRVEYETIAIAFELPTALSLRPILMMLAALSRAERLFELTPTSCRLFSRIEVPNAAAKFAAACASGQLAVMWAQREVAALASQSLRPIRLEGRRGVLYINSSSLLGATAGGALGHIAGVVNALANGGWPPEYWYAVDGPQVDPHVKQHRFTIPDVMCFPAECNHYLVSRGITRQVLGQLEQPDPAFVYQRLTIGNYSGASISSALRRPLVTEYNGSEIWISRNWGSGLRYAQLASQAEDLMLRRSSLVITVSQVLAEELVQRGVEEKRVAWYPNGIDENVFDPARFDRSEVVSLKKELGIPEAAFVACFVGTFAQWHGVEVLAKAIALGKANSWRSTDGRQIHFLLVGDGILMPNVRTIIDEVGAAETVTFTGLVPQREAARYLAASDLLLSPHVPNDDGSRFFGSPTKLFEYMAMEKPIVASALEQLADVLVSDRDSDALGPANARLVPPGDALALWNSVRELADDEPLRDRLARQARVDVLAKHRWSDHVGTIISRLELLDSRGELWA
jgi:glycosyltransferase involved in cell wall biosynthesis